MRFRSVRVCTMFTSAARAAEGASFVYALYAMCACTCAALFAALFAANNFVSRVGAINAASIIICAISIILVVIVAVLVRPVAFIMVDGIDEINETFISERTSERTLRSEQEATPQVKPA